MSQGKMCSWILFTSKKNLHGFNILFQNDQPFNFLKKAWVKLIKIFVNVNSKDKKWVYKQWLYNNNKQSTKIFVLDVHKS